MMGENSWQKKEKEQIIGVLLHESVISMGGSQRSQEVNEWLGASSHLILCRLHLLLPSIFPSIRVFSNELVLCIWRSPEFALFAALLFFELCFMNFGHLCFPELQSFHLEKTTALLASASLIGSWELGLGSKLGKLCSFVRLFPLSEIIVILYSHCPTFENHYIIYIVLISLLV